MKTHRRDSRQLCPLPARLLVELFSRCERTPEIPPDSVKSGERRDSGDRHRGHTRPRNLRFSGPIAGDNTSGRGRTKFPDDEGASGESHVNPHKEDTRRHWLVSFTIESSFVRTLRLLKLINPSCISRALRSAERSKWLLGACGCLAVKRKGKDDRDGSEGRFPSREGLGLVIRGSRKSRFFLSLSASLTVTRVS